MAVKKVFKSILILTGIYFSFLALVNAGDAKGDAKFKKLFSSDEINKAYTAKFYKSTPSRFVSPIKKDNSTNIKNLLNSLEKDGKWAKKFKYNGDSKAAPLIKIAEKNQQIKVYKYTYT